MAEQVVQEEPKKPQRFAPMRTKINGRWLELSEEFIRAHPGGPVITQYADADATHIFHAFHECSQKAYK